MKKLLVAFILIISLFGLAQGQSRHSVYWTKVDTVTWFTTFNIWGEFTAGNSTYSFHVIIDTDGVHWFDNSRTYGVRQDGEMQFTNNSGADWFTMAGSTTGIAISSLSELLNGLYENEILTTIVTSGGVASMQLQNEDSPGSDLGYFIEDVRYTISTPTSVVLAGGTNELPQENWTYIIRDGTNVVLTNLTSEIDLTRTDYVEVARTFIGEVYTSSTTLYKHHETDDNSSRAIKHNNDRNRLEAVWRSGVDPTVTVTVNGAAKDDVIFTSLAGIIYQLHPYNFPAFQVDTDSPTLYVVNITTAYLKIDNLNEIVELSDGTNITNNNRYSLVIWAAINVSTDTCRLFVNAPAGVYLSDDLAIADGQGYSNYNIPSVFDGVGFLIARVTLKYTTIAGGTYTLIETENLRGSTPSNAGGAATVSSEFLDSQFKIKDNADVTKIIDFQASNITTGNTRTITMADEDVDLSKVPDSDKWDGLDSTTTFVNKTSSQTIDGGLILTGNCTAYQFYDKDGLVSGAGAGDGVTEFACGMVWQGEIAVTDELVMTAPAPFAVTIGTITATISYTGETPVGDEIRFTVQASTSNGTTIYPPYDILSSSISFVISAGSSMTVCTAFAITDFDIWTGFIINCDRVGSTTGGGGGGYVGFTIKGIKQ